MDISAVRNAAARHPGLVPEPYDSLVATDGFGAVCCLANSYSGFHVYVPAVRSIFAACVAAQAREELEAGAAVRALARRYGYSERHMRKVLGLG